MYLYRLTIDTYADDLTGNGARLYGGRWNHKGVPCIYTGASRSLCLCEFAVHASLDNVPSGLTMVTFDVPDDSIKCFDQKKLPIGWRSVPTSFENKDFGSELIMAAKHLVIGFPSVVIPHENVFLLNPLHKDFASVKIVKKETFDLDPRLFS